mgnify:CR=1 FL=1
MRIETELDFVYIYKSKRFLTKKEAIRYKELLEHMKNEKELIKEWNEKEKSELTKKAWQDA